MKESKIRRTMKKRHKGRALKGTNGLVGNDAFVWETQMYTTPDQVRTLSQVGTSPYMAYAM